MMLAGDLNPFLSHLSLGELICKRRAIVIVAPLKLLEYVSMPYVSIRYYFNSQIGERCKQW